MNKRLSPIDIAKKSAIDAGKYLKENFHIFHESIFNEGRDIKLKIDQDAERIILDVISEYSELPILSEESGISESLGDNYWVVDPLDGSSNYFRKIRICAVSIALIQNQKPILGVINDFMNDDLYYAERNKGAFCNDKVISVSEVANTHQGTLMTGIPAKQNYTNDEFSSMINLFQGWKKVRMIGSAAIANSYVANGRADCYEEKDTFIWDVAAGAIIVQEAGGIAYLSALQDNFRLNAKFTNGKVK